MKPAATLLLLLLALSGCAQLGVAMKESPLATPITPGEVEWARKSGANTVSGLAALKAGAVSHTCAGESANLIPEPPMRAPA